MKAATRLGSAAGGRRRNRGVRRGGAQKPCEGRRGAPSRRRCVAALRPHRNWKLQRGDRKTVHSSRPVSANSELGADVEAFFNELTGSSQPPTGALRIAVAPNHLLPWPLQAIENGSPRAGRPGQNRAKINGLADTKVIRALYRASEAGVEIDLVVAGSAHYVQGSRSSSRIRVISVLGRFLDMLGSITSRMEVSTVTRSARGLAARTCAAGLRWSCPWSHRSPCPRRSHPRRGARGSYRVGASE